MSADEGLEKRTADFYDADSTSYDDARWASKLGSDTARVQDAIFAELSSDWSGGLGVEVGCGTGRFTRSWAPRVDRVTLVDISSEMLKATSLELARLGIASEQIEAPASRMPIATDTVDWLVCLNVLNHVEDLDAALLEFSRVLKPGAGAIINYSSSSSLYAPAAAWINRRHTAIGQDVYSIWRRPREVEKGLHKAGLLVRRDLGHVHAPRAIYKAGPLFVGPIKALDRASRHRARRVAPWRFLELEAT